MEATARAAATSSRGSSCIEYSEVLSVCLTPGAATFLTCSMANGYSASVLSMNVSSGALLMPSAQGASMQTSLRNMVAKVLSPH